MQTALKLTIEKVYGPTWGGRVRGMGIQCPDAEKYAMFLLWIGGARYSLACCKTEGKWMAYSLTHANGGDFCRVCEKCGLGLDCPLNERMDEIFQAAVRHPSARLRCATKMKPIAKAKAAN